MAAPSLPLSAGSQALYESGQLLHGQAVPSDAVEWLAVTVSRGGVGNRLRLSAGAARKNEVMAIGFALATENVRLEQKPS